MCTVSMIYDYGRANPPWQQQQLPAWQPVPGSLGYPNQLPDTEAREAIKKFLELVEKAKEYDAKTNQPDCEDPSKADFMKEVLSRLGAIEKRLSQIEK